MTDEEIHPYIEAMRAYSPMRDHLWELLRRVADAEAVLRVFDEGRRADELVEVREFLALTAELVGDAALRAGDEVMGVELEP